MKKILLASTALVVTAGVATAQDFSINTDGYFGVAGGKDQYTNDISGDEKDYSFIYDLDFQVVGSTDTDSGLTFVASLDFDDAAGAQGGTDAPGWTGEIALSGDFGTITMGDTSGAAEFIVGDLAGVGVSGLNDYNEFNYLNVASGGEVSELTVFDANNNGVIDAEEVRDTFASSNTPVARYDYSVSGATLALGLDDDGTYSVGASYATDLFMVGLGYERITEDGFSLSNALDSTDEVDHLIGVASVMLSGVELKGIYGRADFDNGDVDQYGVSAAGTFDAVSVSAFYRRVETDFDAGTGLNDEDVDLYGLGVSYDLGGGLALGAGVVEEVADTDDDDSVFAGIGDGETIFDFGVSFSF